VPIFGLANAGVVLSGDVISGAVESPVSQGAALGLVLGKPAGILLFTWLAVRLGLGALPNGAGWRHIAGIGLLGGIGYTVSLLISDLAFETPLLVEQAKMGVLLASLVAGVTGYVFLLLVGRQSTTTEGPGA
jgi:NhaA family Na+:H+ antiporter